MYISKLVQNYNKVSCFSYDIRTQNYNFVEEVTKVMECLAQTIDTLGIEHIFVIFITPKTALQKNLQILVEVLLDNSSVETGYVSDRV